jgi:carbamoyl-phosphate synthase small subunit
LGGGCCREDLNVETQPAQTASSQEALAYKPACLFLSNGPGDPASMDYAVKNVKELVEYGLPTFGICLGHQILGQALGAKTFKLKFGHRGANQPVKDLETGRIEITSQNHGFAVDRKEAEESKDIEITHVHLNDNTIAGISMKNKNCFSVQYHPEASPGPHDASYLFDTFIENITKSKRGT